VLDAALPRYQAREYHEIFVRATPEAALAALLSLPATSDGVVATLFALRGLRGRGKTIRDLMVGMGLHPRTTEREYAGVFSPTRGLARVGFAIYWLFVGPFSALMRRRWLAAAKLIAEHHS
jgi:hypothetical protein